MAIIKKKKQKIKSVGGDVEKLGPLCTIHGNVNGAATMENNMAILEIELSYDPAIPFVAV